MRSRQFNQLKVGQVFMVGQVPCVKVNAEHYSLLVVSPMKHAPILSVMKVNVAAGMVLPHDNFNGG